METFHCYHLSLYYLSFDGGGGVGGILLHLHLTPHCLPLCYYPLPHIIIAPFIVLPTFIVLLSLPRLRWVTFDGGKGTCCRPVLVIYCDHSPTFPLIPPDHHVYTPTFAFTFIPPQYTSYVLSHLHFPTVCSLHLTLLFPIYRNGQDVILRCITSLHSPQIYISVGDFRFYVYVVVVVVPYTIVYPTTLFVGRICCCCYLHSVIPRVDARSFVVYVHHRTRSTFILLFYIFIYTHFITSHLLTPLYYTTTTIHDYFPSHFVPLHSWMETTTRRNRWTLVRCCNFAICYHVIYIYHTHPHLLLVFVTWILPSFCGYIPLTFYSCCYDIICPSIYVDLLPCWVYTTHLYIYLIHSVPSDLCYSIYPFYRLFTFVVYSHSATHTFVVTTFLDLIHLLLFIYLHTHTFGFVVLVRWVIVGIVVVPFSPHIYIYLLSVPSGESTFPFLPLTLIWIYFVVQLLLCPLHCCCWRAGALMVMGQAFPYLALIVWLGDGVVGVVVIVSCCDLSGQVVGLYSPILLLLFEWRQVTVWWWWWNRRVSACYLLTLLCVITFKLLVFHYSHLLLHIVPHLSLSSFFPCDITPLFIYLTFPIYSPLFIVIPLLLYWPDWPLFLIYCYCCWPVTSLPPAPSSLTFVIWLVGVVRDRALIVSLLMMMISLLMTLPRPFDVERPIICCDGVDHSPCIAIIHIKWKAIYCPLPPPSPWWYHWR